MKRINKLLMTGVLMFSLPSVVMAADLSFGKTETKDNVTIIPVSLEVNDGDAIKNVIINGCKTNYGGNVACEVEVVETAGILYSKSGNGYAFSALSSEPVEGEESVEATIPNGTNLVRLIVTNGDNARYTDVKVSLVNSSIDGTLPKSDEVICTVNAKAVEKTKSSDATLKGIKFSQGTIYPEFSASVDSYTVYNIADTINTVRITPTCNEGECDFKVSGGKSVSGSVVTLYQGSNSVALTVTSENGLNTNTYTFNVIRGETTFDSAKLSSLSFGENELVPAFNPDTLEYNLSVMFGTTNVKNILKYVTADESATVKVTGGEKLEIGANTVKVTVTNGSASDSKEYVITVNREVEEDIKIIKYYKSEVTYINSLNSEVVMKIDDFKVEFPTEYNKIMNNEYKFNANGELITGEEMTTTTTAPVVIGSKDSKIDNKKLLLIIGLVSLGVIIICVAGFLIFRKKKDDVEMPEELIDDEAGVEEEVIAKQAVYSDATIDVDEALSDLMNTKSYNFKDDE